MNSDIAESLRKFAGTGCEEAFRRLVELHAGLVYATALRRLSGDAHAARDVAQVVFCDLARKARGFSADLVLAGWLYHRTCLRSAEHLRSESRRNARERTAAQMNTINRSTDTTDPELESVLDLAMQRLSRKDRDVLVLRFLQSASLRAVGEAFGVSEDAAQKRVDRALIRLRRVLAGQGFTCSAAALATYMGVTAVQAAPVGLAALLASAALANAAAAPFWSTTLTLLMSKTKIALAGAAALCAATTLVVQQQNLRGYVICQRGALTHSGRSCRTDGNEVTIRPVGHANPQVGLREMLVEYARGNSPFL